jgi:DNA-3-methyladenine glycosylase I
LADSAFNRTVGVDPHRCRWAQADPLLRQYHDEEWGRPERDPRVLWEKLMLDGFQAGLSWKTILKKRDAFRVAFRGFDPSIVAAFGADDVARLVEDAGIIRSRMKIEAVIRNAGAYLRMLDSGENFADFAWSAIGAVPLVGDGMGIATRSGAGDALSAGLKVRGFSFVGPVIVHAWLQATGLIDDHESGCFRRGMVDWRRVPAAT